MENGDELDDGLGSCLFEGLVHTFDSRFFLDLLNLSPVFLVKMLHPKAHLVEPIGIDGVFDWK